MSNAFDECMHGNFPKCDIRFQLNPINVDHRGGKFDHNFVVWHQLDQQIDCQYAYIHVSKIGNAAKLFSIILSAWGSSAKNGSYNFHKRALAHACFECWKTFTHKSNCTTSIMLENRINMKLSICRSTAQIDCSFWCPFRSLSMAYSQLDLAHIPSTLRDPTLAFSVEGAWTGNFPTVCIGIIDQTYTEVSWKTDKQNILALFGVSDSTFVCDIKIIGIGGRQVDGQRLADDTTQATKFINKSNSTKIRIVSLGKASANAVFEAKESLIRGWQVPVIDRNLQYLTSGDSKNFTNLNFCKALCLKQLCKRIQFYNTMDYNQYGYYRAEMPFHKLAQRVQLG